MLSSTADARSHAPDPTAASAPDHGSRAPTCATSSSATSPPYAGEAAFLAGPTDRTTRVWDILRGLMLEERDRGGVLDVDASTPSAITAHAPGLHQPRRRARSSACRPMRRCGARSSPTAAGGWSRRASSPTASSPTSACARSSPSIARPTTTASLMRTRPTILAARRAGIVTGLPDAYGRGRIIGDYRRVALYGVDQLIEWKRQERAELDAAFGTEEIIRDREELAEQIRALGELQDDGGEIRSRHLPAGRDGARGGAVALLRLPGRGQGAERRGDVARAHLDLPRRLLRARPRRRHAGERVARPRSSSTTSS